MGHAANLVADFFIRIFIGCLFTLAIIAGFLHPAYADPAPKTDEAIVVLICHCGKPVFGIASTSKEFKMARMMQAPDLVSACKSYQPAAQIGKLSVFIKYVEESRQECPLTI